MTVQRMDTDLPRPGWPQGVSLGLVGGSLKAMEFGSGIKRKTKSQGCPGRQDFLFPCSGHSTAWALVVEFGLWKDDGTRDPIFFTTTKF